MLLQHPGTNDPGPERLVFACKVELLAASATIGYAKSHEGHVES